MKAMRSPQRILLLAMLLGVNLGPNLTYVGSLAIMLWRRVAARAGSPADLRTFTILAMVPTPLTLFAAVVALWACEYFLTFGG